MTGQSSVGIVGMGRMGRRIAERLCAAGVDVVGFQRGELTADAAASQIPLASSLEQLAGRTHTLLLVLPGPAETEDLLWGCGALAAYIQGGTLLIDLSTTDPLSSQRFARDLLRQQVVMIDAPMTGSTSAAEAGELGFLIGGEADAVANGARILGYCGTYIYHCGPNGSGCAAKLALNLILGGIAFALAEALAIVRAAGVPEEVFLEAIGTSPLKSPALARLGQRALAEDFETRFAIEHFDKDIDLLIQYSQHVGLELEFAQLLMRGTGRAAKREVGADYSILIKSELERLFARSEPVRGRRFHHEGTDQPDIHG